MRILIFMLCLSFSLSLNAFQGVDGLDKKQIEVEYIAHASFKISTATSTILLDPFADKVWIGYSFPPNVEADAIFSTHPHYDHDGGIYLKKHPYWEGKIPMHTDPGEYTVGDINVRGIKGKHSDPYGKEFGQKNTIWIIEAGGLKIAHLGDNGPLFPENVEELQGLDLLMVPIDAEYHILKKEELATVLEQLKPRVVVPMHYKIESLEHRPGKPQDLGPIYPYLVGKKGVFFAGNKYQISKKEVRSGIKFLVFQHSPQIKD